MKRMQKDISQRMTVCRARCLADGFYLQKRLLNHFYGKALNLLFLPGTSKAAEDGIMKKVNELLGRVCNG